MTSVLIKESLRKMWDTQRRPHEHRGGAGVMHSQIKECPEPPGTGKDKEGIFPGNFIESVALLTPWFQASSLQSYENTFLLF